MTSRAPLKRSVSFTAALILLLFGGAASASIVYLSFFIADQGTFVPFGSSQVLLTGDTNHAAVASEYAGVALTVIGPDGGSLSATRNVYLPCLTNEWKLVTNETTGGQQVAIGCGQTDGGAAGATALVPNGLDASVLVLSPDGINYYTVGSGGGGGGGAFDAAVLSVGALSANLLTLDGGFTMGGGTNVQSTCDPPTEVTINASGWYTLYTQASPGVNTATEFSARSVAWDYSYGDGGQLIPNEIACSLLWEQTSGVDGGLYTWGVGTSADSGASIAPSCAPIQLGCTSNLSNAGCTSYSTNASTNPVSLQYQAINSGSGVAMQVAYWTDAGAYPTYKIVTTTCRSVRRQPSP
jgi:hypothetical protein